MPYFSLLFHIKLKSYLSSSSLTCSKYIPYVPDPGLGIQRRIHRDKIYRAKKHSPSAHVDVILSERQTCKEQLNCQKIKARMKICTMFIRAWREKFLLVLSFNREGLVRCWTGRRAIQAQSKHMHWWWGVKEHEILSSGWSPVSLRHRMWGNGQWWEIKLGEWYLSDKLNDASSIL